MCLTILTMSAYFLQRLVKNWLRLFVWHNHQEPQVAIAPHPKISNAQLFNASIVFQFQLLQHPHWQVNERQG